MKKPYIIPWEITIRSGGQEGADLAGLKIGKEIGLNVVCCMPKGFRTKSGLKPEYKEIYNAYETESSNYSVRTYENVCESDITFRFARNFDSPGEKCTLRAIKYHNKPREDFFIDESYAIVRMRHNDLTGSPVNALLIRNYIIDHHIKTINIAGNSDPKIEKPVMDFLRLVLCRIG